MSSLSVFHRGEHDVFEFLSDLDMEKKIGNGKGDS